MFADVDPGKYIIGEKVVGELGDSAKRGEYGNANRFIQWIAENGLEKPAFTTVGRWKYGQAGTYINPVYIPWFTIDLDCYDPIEVWEDALDILSILDIEGYDLRRVYVSYSGKKGFHIQISAKQFGTPVFENTDAAQVFIQKFTEDIADGSKWDRAVTSPQSLIRVSGSRHGDTGKYKRTWYADNFRKLSPELIFSNIGEHKSFDFVDSGGIVRGAREHFKEIIPAAKQCLSERRLQESEKKDGKIISTIKPGLVEGEVFGDKAFHVGRENGAYILGCWYLERYSESVAWKRMKAWNNRNDPPLPVGRLKTQFRGSKRTIYDHRR